MFSARRHTLAALIAVCVPTAACAQQLVPKEVGWLGLYSNELLSWLENENQISTLCPRNFPESLTEEQVKQHSVAIEAFNRCQMEKREPKVLVTALRAGPVDNAPAVGSLVIVATPGRGLSAFFLPVNRGVARHFWPDLYMADWGYGPYFHETFLERRGTWFRLPEDPFLPGSWINASALDDEPDVQALEVDEIWESSVGDIVILGVEQGVVRARLEQDRDMWCREGEPPALKPWKELRIPFRDLYTASGHLRLQKKYTKGC
jgi:hypothetical protein